MGRFRVADSMPHSRIVLFGDGAWAARSLKRLRREEYVVAGVVPRRRPSDDALERAAEACGIPVLRLDDVNSADAVGAVAALAPDLTLSIACDRILRRPMREAARLGTVNFHAGRLPRYRGRNVINWALINGEREIGVTAHVMDDGIDTGPILLQRLLPVSWTDGYGDVLARVVATMPDLVAETVAGLIAGRLAPRPQNHADATYFAGRADGDEWLDWGDTAVNLHNKIRAITRPGPGARTMLGDREVTIWRALHHPGAPRYLATPGQVVGRGDGALVKTGDSTILVQEIEVAGAGSVLPAWPIGTRLGVPPAPAGWSGGVTR